MKTSLLALLVALSASSALAAAPAAPAALDNTPFGYAVSAIPQPNQVDITIGTTQMTVRQQMGAPLRKLAPNVWTYTGYHPSVADDQIYGCDTLIITFANGTVSDLKIVNKYATSLIATNLQLRPVSARVAKN